ncbi:MAG: hypothetical protein CMK07_05515 [Ponticaulis sp.]|nr:hypothetical protein [Ponticaulis sp.]
MEKPVKTKSLTRLASGIFALGLTFCAGQSASAQERLPFSGGMGGDLAGAMLVKPGGILFSTFDANKDFEITEDEIEVGARQAFVFADADGDGYMSPLEQRNWAGRISSESDVLANPTTFLSALPGQVTEDEFVEGLLTFSQRFADASEDGRIFIRDFSFTPDRPSARNVEAEGGLERLRRPVITDRPNAGGLR